MRKFLLVLFFIVRILFDKSLCADAHSGGGGEEFGGTSGGGGSDFGYDTSIFVDHDASNSYSLTSLNQVTCDASVSVDKILVVQDSLELSHFTIRPILSDNASGAKVTLVLYAGYDQYDMHKVKETRYKPDMMIDFDWNEHFKTDLMNLEKIHFMIVPEVEMESVSSPKTYTFPIQVTCHDCDPENPECPGGMSSDGAGTFLMPLSEQVFNGTVDRQVERDGVLVLLWVSEPQDNDNAWTNAEYLFYYKNTSGEWENDCISSVLYTMDGNVYNGHSSFNGNWLKDGTAWSELFSFQYAPQFVIPWERDFNYDAVPALYFDTQDSEKKSTGHGFYCSFPMNGGVMQRTGSGTSVGDGTNLDDGLEKDYDSETGDRTDSSKGPLDTIVDFLFGTSELEKASAIAFRKVPFAFFTYLPEVADIFVNENYSSDKLHFDIPIHMGKYWGEQKIKFKLDIFSKDQLIHDLVHNLFRLLAYAGTGFFLFGIIQKTANFLSG